MNAAANPNGQDSTTTSLQSGVPPVPPEGSPTAVVEGTGSGAVDAQPIEAVKHADYLSEARRGYLASKIGSRSLEQFDAALHINAWRLCKDYRSDFWSLWKLSNGGFFLVPRTPEPVCVERDGYCGELSAHEFGIALTLLALKAVCWITSYEGRHLDLRVALRDYAMERVEAHKILRLVD